MFRIYNAVRDKSMPDRDETGWIVYYIRGKFVKKASLRAQLLTEKTLNYLLENANIKDTPEPSASEAEAQESENDAGAAE